MDSYRSSDWGRRAGILCLVLFVMLSGSVFAQDQYQVYAWENFETAQLPTTLEMKLSANENNVLAVNYSTPGLPMGILEGGARVECGQYGLRLDTTSDKPHLSVVNSSVLDRRLLGAQGKALYQADFYLPAPGTHISTNVAVLANAKIEAGSESSYRSYRVGLLDGTKLFFSYTDGLVKKGAPVLYKQEDISEWNIQQPGWHRLQIIFDGQENIICALDGRPTNFSPLPEPTLIQLQAGIMVTTPKSEQITYYADNLSIQWTDQNIPIPESPWSAGFASTAMGTANIQPGFPSTTPGAAGGDQINWNLAPNDAWQAASAQGKSILVLFTSPRIRNAQALDQLFASDASARQLVNQLVPLRVDVNQLIGGSLAQHFGIFRVPTLMIMGIDGQVKARVTYDANTPWATIASQLQPAMPPAAPAPAPGF